MDRIFLMQEFLGSLQTSLLLGFLEFILKIFGVVWFIYLLLLLLLSKGKTSMFLSSLSMILSSLKQCLFHSEKNPRIRQNPQELAKNVLKERQSRLLIKWKLRSVWNGVLAIRRKTEAAQIVHQVQMCFVSVFRAGEGSIFSSSGNLFLELQCGFWNCWDHAACLSVCQSISLSPPNKLYSSSFRQIQNRREVLD